MSVAAAEATEVVAGTAGAGAGGAPELGVGPGAGGEVVAPQAGAGQDAPDPEVVVSPAPQGTEGPQAGEEWTLLSTNTLVGGLPANVPAWRSHDRAATWQYVGDALPALGAWANPGYTWAPGTLPLPAGGFALYYTARHRDAGIQCIGVATADAPAGPYVDRLGRPLVCQGELGGSIDADALVAPDGTPYLTWKSDENNPAVGTAPRLWAQPLAPSGLELQGTPTVLVTGAPGLDGIVEAPSLFTRPDGRFGLVWSTGWWESPRYGMRQADCASPLGPCTPLMWQGPDPALGGGGGSVFRDAAGQPHLAYHRWVGPPSYREGGVRAAAIVPL